MKKITLIKSREISEKIKNYFAFLVLIMLLLIFSFMSPNFRTLTNMNNIAQQSAVLIIASLGVTLVILSGSIDLSVGSILGLTAVITAAASTNFGPFSILVGPLIGLVAGFITGTIFSKGKVPSFIVTLAMLTILRGIVLTFTRGRPIPIQDSLVISIANVRILGVPFIFLVAIFFLLIAYLITELTPFGRYVKAIGGDEKVAGLSGINIDRTKIFIFMVSSVFVGFAGVLQASRIGAGVPTTGEGFELDVIASIVLGGTTLTGGVGSVIGTVIGALTMTVLSSGLNIIGVNPYAQYIVKGIVLVSAVLISINRKKIGIIK